MQGDYNDKYYDQQYSDDEVNGEVQLDHCKLYVRNIPEALNKDGLRCAFENNASNVKVFMNEDPMKRYAIVPFKTALQAKLAMIRLNKTEPLNLVINMAHKEEYQHIERQSNPTSQLDRSESGSSEGSNFREPEELVESNDSEDIMDIPGLGVEEEFEFESELEIIHAEMECLRLQEEHIKCKQRLKSLKRAAMKPLFPGLQRYICLTCGSPADSHCDRCGIAPYCSRKCQLEDWQKRHRAVCRNPSRPSPVPLREPTAIQNQQVKQRPKQNFQNPPGQKVNRYPNSNNMRRPNVVNENQNVQDEEESFEIPETPRLMLSDVVYVELPRTGCDLEVFINFELLKSGSVNARPRLPDLDTKMEELTNRMEEYYSSDLGKCPYLPQLEECCIVLYPRYPRCFRATVCELVRGEGGSLLRVCYLDYGRMGTVPVADVRRMLPEFMEAVPALGLHVNIRGMPKNAPDKVLANAFAFMQRGVDGRRRLRVRNCECIGPGVYEVDAPELLAALKLMM